MPNRIRVDATPPVVKLRHVGPRILEPGSAAQGALPAERAGARLRLPRRQARRARRSSRLKWKVEWPVRARPGKHRVTVTARDIAGNLSDATRPVVVVVPLRVLTHAGERAASRERFSCASRTTSAPTSGGSEANGRLCELERAPASRAEARRPLPARDQAGPGGPRRPGRRDAAALEIGPIDTIFGGYMVLARGIYRG